MKNSTIYMTLLVLLTLVGFNSCGSNNSNSPGKSVIALFDSMKSKDFEKSASMYVKNKGEKLSKEEAKKLEGMIGMGAKNYEKKGGLDSITIDEEKISEDGNSAKVSFTIYYKNGKTEKETMHLAIINGKWMFEISN